MAAVYARAAGSMKLYGPAEDKHGFEGGYRNGL